MVEPGMGTKTKKGGKGNDLGKLELRAGEIPVPLMQG
jgi:hypothetical protein